MSFKKLQELYFLVILREMTRKLLKRVQRVQTVTFKLLESNNCFYLMYYIFIDVCTYFNELLLKTHSTVLYIGQYGSDSYSDLFKLFHNPGSVQ